MFLKTLQMNQDSKRILLDADVLSHFMTSGNCHLLHRIFTNKKVVLSIVAKEIRRHPTLRGQLDWLIKAGEIEEIQMPNSSSVLLEFASLSKSKGLGESACMAVARFDPSVIASNNFRDVRDYCELHQISYLSTMDMIYEGYRSGIMDLATCDYMIYNLITLKNPARLPCTNLKEYCNKQHLPFPIH